MPLEALPPKDLGCHRTGFEKKCRDLVSDGLCNRWRHELVIVEGKQTTWFDCVDNWSSHYSREAGMQVHGLYAIIESARNEILALAGHKNGHPDALPLGTPLNGAALKQITSKE